MSIKMFVLIHEVFKFICFFFNICIVLKEAAIS